MNQIVRTKPEYGGFLPLELNDGQEFFSRYEGCLRRFNSVKASLVYLIQTVPLKKIYLPYYYCPSTTAMIQSTGIAVSFYHITEELVPEDIPDETDSAVLLVDYFGVKTEAVHHMVQGFTHAYVILDHAHAFFAEPTMRDTVYNLYSAKKFFGIPDGAYLIGNQVIRAEDNTADSYAYADYLLVSYEKGTNEAYQMKKKADRLIADNPGGMSRLASGLLRNVDYTAVQKKRTGNYQALHQRLHHMNKLSLPDACAAYHYPLLIENHGRTIKQELIRQKIYVPTLWSGEMLLKYGNSFELSMSHDAVFVPVDQRYDAADMAYIADCILSAWNAINRL